MDAEASIQSLLEQSHALQLAGEIPQALRLAQQALAEAEAVADPAVKARVLYRLGKLHFRLGHFAQAESLAHEVLALAPPASLPYAEGLILAGNCAAETNSLVRAEDCFHQAIDLCRELGHPEMRSRTLHDLAIAVYMPRGQFDLALAAEHEALQIARRQAMGVETWFALFGIGWMHWLAGRREQAYQAAQEIDQVVQPDSTGAGYCLSLRGNLALDDGLPDEALALYTRSRSIAETVGDPGLNVLVRLGLSRCQRVTGDAPGARRWAHDAVMAAARVGYEHFRGMALVERGRASRAAGELASAAADFRAALEPFARLEARYDEALARLLLASLLQQQANPEAQEQWAAAARHILDGGYAFLVDRERALAYPLIAAYLDGPNATLARDCRTLLCQLQRVPAPPLRITALGDLRIEQGARSVDRNLLRRRRAGELLLILLLSPTRSLFLDQIADRLYPDARPAALRDSLYKATSALRRALEPDLPEKFPSRYLDVGDEQARLNLPPGSWVDFEEFERGCDRGEWEAALALYGGDLAPGYLYADWTAAPRERLVQRRIEALLCAARRRLAAGDCQGALAACQGILASERWHEEATVIAMRACESLGNVPAALSHYRRLQKALQEEFGIAPQPETRELYGRLVAR